MVRDICKYPVQCFARLPTGILGIELPSLPFCCCILKPVVYLSVKVQVCNVHKEKGFSGQIHWTVSEATSLPEGADVNHHLSQKDPVLAILLNCQRYAAFRAYHQANLCKILLRKSAHLLLQLFIFSLEFQCPFRHRFASVLWADSFERQSPTIRTLSDHLRMLGTCSGRFLSCTSSWWANFKFSSYSVSVSFMFTPIDYAWQDKKNLIKIALYSDCSEIND